MRELDVVALSRDVVEQGLRAGDVGTVVHVHRGDAAFEVEFVTGSGRTLAVLTLPAGDLRSVRGDEILHTRILSGADVRPGAGELSPRR